MRTWCSVGRRTLSRPGSFLDPLAGAGNPDQGVQVDRPGGVAQELGQFASVRVVADEQPPMMSWLRLPALVAAGGGAGAAADAGVGPLVEAFALAAVAGRQGLPAAVWYLLGHGVGAGLAFGVGIWVSQDTAIT